MAKLNFMMEVIKQGIMQETVHGITQYMNQSNRDRSHTSLTGPKVVIN